MVKRLLDALLTAAILIPIPLFLIAAIWFGLHRYINTGATGLQLDKYGETQLPNEDFDSFKRRVSTPSVSERIMPKGS